MDHGSNTRWVTVAITVMLIAWTLPASGEWTQWRGSADHDAHAQHAGAIQSPRLAWSFNLTNQHPIASPTVGVVDGDTLVFLAGYTTPTGGTTRGSVYALTPEGDTVWEARPPIGNLGGFAATPALVEDEDGTGLIAAQVEASTVYRFDANDGSQVASFRMGSSDSDLIMGSPTVADVSGDGTPEVLLPGSQSGDDGTLFVLESDLSGVLFEHELNAPAWSSPLVADVTGDGTDEIIVSTGVPDAACFIFGSLHPTANPKTGDDQGRVYAFTPDGDGGWDLLWDTLLQGPTMSSPVAADLDEDGDMEIVVGNQDERGSCVDPTNLQLDAFLTILDGAQGAVHDARPGPLPLSIGTPLVTTLEDDGPLEIIHGDWNGVEALTFDQGTLSAKRSYSITDDRHEHDHWVIASPAAVDIDDDGTANVLALSLPIDVNEENPLNSETKPGMLVAIEPTTDANGFQTTWEHPTPTDGGLSGPIPADVNGNGYSEVLFGMGLPVVGDSHEARMIDPANPIVDGITHTPTDPESLESVTFEASVLYPAGDPASLTYAWDFDDDATSIHPSPTHAFSGYGTYNVTLTVTDTDGHTWTQTHPVTVEPLDPLPAFTHQPIPPDPNEDATFTDESTHPDPDLTITNWHWDFGDGNTSTDQHPTHTYEEPGAYTVTLTVTDAYPQHATHTETVRVNAPPLPSFSYATDTPEPRVNEPLTFTDESSDPDGTITNWHWDFGDGNTSTDQHPTHTYEEPGAYTVTLTVTDNNDTSAQASSTLTVENWPPTAAFEHTPTVPDPDEEVTFIDESTHPQAPSIEIESWHWDFGDGNTSTDQHPTHTYTEQASHDVTLTVTDTEGKTDTRTTTLHVGVQPPDPGFLLDPPSPRVHEEIRFTDVSTHPEEDATIEAWHWDFGEGNTSTDQHPTHAYATVGTHTATLTVTDDRGLASTHTETLTIRPQAQAVITANPANVDRPITFNATSSQAPGSQIEHYEWILDGETLSTDPVHEIAFHAPGERCLTLRIEATNGLTDETPACVNVEDALDVSASMTKATYDASQKATGSLTAQYANGDPVPHATFAVTITYRTGNEALDTLLEASCLSWSTTVTAGATGLAWFVVPPAVERCGGPVDLLEMPGHYEADIQASWGANAGATTTTYETTPLG